MMRSVVVAVAASVSVDLVKAVVIVMVLMALAPCLPLVLLDFTVLIFSTLVSLVHACLHVSKVACAGAHKVGSGHRFDLDKVGKLTDTSGIFTALHAVVVTVVFMTRSIMARSMMGPVMGDLHAASGAVPQWVGGGLLALMLRFTVDDSMPVPVAVRDGANLIGVTLVHLVETSR